MFGVYTKPEVKEDVVEHKEYWGELEPEIEEEEEEEDEDMQMDSEEEVEEREEQISELGGAESSYPGLETPVTETHEAPEPIELRKSDDKKRDLYKVLEAKPTDVSGFMGSEQVYDLELEKSGTASVAEYNDEADRKRRKKEDKKKKESFKF